MNKNMDFTLFDRKHNLTNNGTTSLILRLVSQHLLELFELSIDDFNIFFLDTADRRVIVVISIFCIGTMVH